MEKKEETLICPQGKLTTFPDKCQTHSAGLDTAIWTGSTSFKTPKWPQTKWYTKKRHHFLAQFSIPFHMVWSILLRVLAQKITFPLVEILWVSQNLISGFFWHFYGSGCSWSLPVRWVLKLESLSFFSKSLSFFPGPLSLFKNPEVLKI